MGKRKFKEKVGFLKNFTKGHPKYKSGLQGKVNIDNINKLFREHTVYVFGYGSLLFEHGWKGRGMLRPPKEGELFECKLNNFDRGPWGLLGMYSFYGIIQTPGKTINGVLARIYSPVDWFFLMSSERIAGLFKVFNYYAVDVTANISNVVGTQLPKNTVIHAVCNSPENREGCIGKYPYHNYYDYVWSGVTKFRSEAFAEEFLRTGGVKSSYEAGVCLHVV